MKKQILLYVFYIVGIFNKDRSRFFWALCGNFIDF